MGLKVGENHQFNQDNTEMLTRYLKFCQWHLGHAELTAGLSVFTFPAQVVGDLFPHHPLFTFTQRTRDLEEGTHVQVVLRGKEETRG